jgi:hypothetical protein
LKPSALVPLAVCLACLACAGQKSPSELARALRAKGVHAEVKGEAQPDEASPGAELNIDLVLDYEEAYKAARFPSSDLARSYCNTVSMGVHTGDWCLHPVSGAPKMETFEKVRLLATPVAK